MCILYIIYIYNPCWFFSPQPGVSPFEDTSSKSMVLGMLLGREDLWVQAWSEKGFRGVRGFRGSSKGYYKGIYRGLGFWV